MAAHSRPPPRSSTRTRNASLEEVPPTDIQQNPLPNTRRGKRTRDSSPGSISNASTKKQKAHIEDDICPKGPVKTEFRNALPIRDRRGTKDAVTQVGTSRNSEPPLHSQRNQPQAANGSTILAHKTQASVYNTNLSINTDNDTNGKDKTSQADKRSLRSQAGGSRSKSELALYFTNYDELVSIEPKEPDFLTPETLLYITDEPTKPSTKLSHPTPPLTNGHKRRLLSSPQPPTLNGSSQCVQLTEETFTTLNDAERIDLHSLDKSTRHSKDPLPDTVFLKPHRRAERAEKQLRNIEKERAMHEKVQLERLLDGLKGHDWLRVMGISGITDGEKKQYEPKRDYFIREVRVLLVKFQEWKEEEKRRKVEKEESMQDEDEEQLSEDDEDDQDGEQDQKDYKSDADPPDHISIDASARQLHREATLATKSHTSSQSQPPKRSHRKKESPPGPPPDKPFTSFYSKPYLRDAAIGKHRRGRVRFAFGQPLPEVGEQEFELGQDILTSDAVRASERKRRASKRAREAEEGSR
ncbi:hypothetical protein P7C71_g6478, partial [Lecanoromycetidae sp. Uapishka_2]